MATKFELNSTTPAPPAGKVNIVWQSDVSGNVSGYTAGVVASVFGRTGVVVAQSGDYAVAQVTGAVPDTRTIIAGTGLSGGGALSGNVTLSANIAGIQTPWLSNINGGNFDLSNVNDIAATGNVAVPYGGSFAANVSFDGTNWRYIAAGPAFACSAFGTATTFYAAASGSAGAVAPLGARISFPDSGGTAFTGNVGIGAAVPGYQLDVGGHMRLRHLGVSSGSLLWFDGSSQTARAAVGIKENSNSVYRLFSTAIGGDILLFDLAVGGMMVTSYAGANMDGLATRAGQWYTYAPSNTQLAFRLYGSDGIWRQAVLTFA